MAGVGRQHLPAQTLGLAQAPGLVTVQRRNERRRHARQRRLRPVAAWFRFCPALFAVHGTAAIAEIPAGMKTGAAPGALLGDRRDRPMIAASRIRGV